MCNHYDLEGLVFKGVLVVFASLSMAVTISAVRFRFLHRHEPIVIPWLLL
jgi:hypothetical protein